MYWSTSRAFALVARVCCNLGFQSGFQLILLVLVINSVVIRKKRFGINHIFSKVNKNKKQKYFQELIFIYSTTDMEITRNITQFCCRSKIENPQYFQMCLHFVVLIIKVNLIICSTTNYDSEIQIQVFLVVLG